MFKKSITLVAALSCFSMAILIPVVASNAATVTICPAGVSGTYCSVSNLGGWTAKQKNKTLTVTLKLPSGSGSTVGWRMPSGVKLLTAPKTFIKDMAIKSGKKSISYTIQSSSSSQATVKLRKAAQALTVTVNTALFKTKAKRANVTLIVTSGSGTSYTESLPVKF